MNWWWLLPIFFHGQMLTSEVNVSSSTNTLQTPTSHELCNNNKPFKGLLSRLTRVTRYQRKHQLTHTICGYYTTSLINFLHFLRFIASSLCICQIWLSSSRPTTSENLVLKGVIELIWTNDWPPAAWQAASTCVDRSQRRTEPCVACREESAGHRSASAPPINSQSQSLFSSQQPITVSFRHNSQSQSLLITTANHSLFSSQQPITVSSHYSPARHCSHGHQPTHSTMTKQRTSEQLRNPWTD